MSFRASFHHLRDDFTLENEEEGWQAVLFRPERIVLGRYFYNKLALAALAVSAPPGTLRHMPDRRDVASAPA